MLEIHEQLTSDDVRHARQYLRRIVGGLLVVAFLLFTVIWATKAHAADPSGAFVADIGTSKLFLYQEPCALGGWFSKWKKGTWQVEGKLFDACWKLQRDADDQVYVHTVDADGDAGSVPARMFKKATGI